MNTFKPGVKVRSKMPYGDKHRTGTVIAPRNAQEKRYVKSGYLVIMMDTSSGDTIPQMVEAEHYEVQS